jgi:hypothetical protein
MLAENKGSICSKPSSLYRSENVVQVALNRANLQTKGEERRRNSFGCVCLNLLLLSGLARFRQALIDFVSRLQSRCSPS